MRVYGSAVKGDEGGGWVETDNTIPDRAPARPVRSAAYGRSTSSREPVQHPAGGKTGN
jgi:hypothetical protein